MSISGQFLLYTAPDGAVKVDVHVQQETAWLTQKALAELFGVKRPAITKHLQNIFKTAELVEDWRAYKPASLAAEIVDDLEAGLEEFRAVESELLEQTWVRNRRFPRSRSPRPISQDIEQARAEGCRAPPYQLTMHSRPVRCELSPVY